MGKYKIETHAHTSETSSCGKMSAAEAVRLYHSLGYSGIMITDHFHKYTFEKLEKENPTATWDDKIDYFLRGYKSALKVAEKIPGFKVYLGCELCYYERTKNDYLIFGLTEEKLRQMKDIVYFKHKKGLKCIRDNVLTIIQAHPYRGKNRIIRPKLLDGVEIFNGQNDSGANKKVEIRAEKYGFKIKTSGSDFHGRLIPNGGIITDTLPENESELQKIILNNCFETVTSIEKKELKL